MEPSHHPHPGHPRRLEQRLAHLSYQRILYEDADEWWPIGQLAHDLMETFNDFLRALDSPRREWFADEIDPEHFNLETWGRS